MEPWPLASVQYATAVNPILSMKTEWLSSAHMLCLLRRAFLSKQFLTVYFHITFIGIFINCCESLTSSHLLSLTAENPVRVTCNWSATSVVSWRSPSFCDLSAASYCRSLLPVCSAYPFTQPIVVLFSNSLPPLLSVLIQGFLYCPPCGQMPACSTLCAWHSTSAEPQTSGFLLM